MINKRYIFIFISLFMLNVTGQSLPETIEIALKNNPTIQAKQEAVISAQKQAEAVKSKTLPTLDFDASYRHITHVAVMDVAENLPPSLQGGFAPFQLGNYDTYDLGISATYMLFTGFAHQNSMDIKNEQWKLTENNLKKTKKDIAFQVIAAYRQIQSRYFEISALESAKERTELQLHRVKILVNQGMALALDTLDLTLAKLSYTQKIIAAKASLTTANELLNNFAGQKIKVKMFSEYELPVGDETTDFENNERLVSLKIQENILSFNKELTRSGYYPSVALNAAFKYGDPGADIIKREWMGYGVWGVGVHWNIFQWGADSKAEEAGEANIRQLQHQYRALNDNIRTEYEKSKRELTSLREQLNVLKMALLISNDKLRLIENRYKQGMASGSDFNDANLNMTETELKYRQFLTAVALKLNELDYKSGKPIQHWRIEQ